MSGIVGSYFNTRGSGVVAKLGSDGQVFTSTGAGLSQGFEAAAGGGKIGQVVTAQLADEYSYSNTTFAALTDYTVTITPSATTSKIWLQGHINWSASANYTLHLQLYRDAVEINSNSFSATSGYWGSGINEGYSVLRTAPVSFVDSPSTASATVYTVQQRWNVATGYINRIGASTVMAGTSVLHGIEILA